MFTGAIRAHCPQMDSYIYRQKLGSIKPSQRNVQSCLGLWRGIWLSHWWQQVRAGVCFTFLRCCYFEKEGEGKCHCHHCPSVSHQPPTSDQVRISPKITMNTSYQVSERMVVKYYIIWGSILTFVTTLLII